MMTIYSYLQVALDINVVDNPEDILIDCRHVSFYQTIWKRAKELDIFDIPLYVEYGQHGNYGLMDLVSAIPSTTFQEFLL